MSTEAERAAAASTSPRTPAAPAASDSASDAIIVVDRYGLIVMASPRCESMFGQLFADLLGRHVEVLVPDRFSASHPTRRDGFFDDPRVRKMGAGMDFYAVRKDGTEFPVEISLSPLETDEGVLVSAAIRDVTERNRLKEETYRLREELIATVSHDLRTPLTSILGYTELMQDLGDDDVSPVARRLLAVIARNTHRELRLGQVVDNLLTNAVKFTQPGGRVDVRVRDEDGMVVLEVDDNGVGMSTAELERIFDRLYRSASAVRGAVPGIGLGLSIVQAIVNAHSGSVDAESSLGSGTVVRVRLPYAEV